MSTTTVTGEAVSSRRSSTISRACAWVDRVSMTSGRVVAKHDADVLVEEGIAPHEHAIADLDPASHVDDGNRAAIARFGY